MNVDRTLFVNKGKSGMEAIIRDREGEVLATISHIFPMIHLPNVVEVLRANYKKHLIF